MASQITHIVYGKKIFDRTPNLNWHDFVIGTVFPDIRYLANLQRDATHVFNTKEEDIPKNNSFQAGFYTHCFIDEKREQILHSLGMYQLLPRDYLNATAIKMLEDYFTYPQFEDWQGICNILNSRVTEEQSYGADIQTIDDWHKGLQGYIQSGPNKASWSKVLIDIIPEVTAKQIAERANELQQNEEVCAILKKVYLLI